MRFHFFNGTVIDSPQIFIDIFPQLRTLFGSNGFIICNMPFLVTWKDVILLFAWYKEERRARTLFDILKQKNIGTICFNPKIKNKSAIGK